MSRFNTGNPLGSGDPRDLDDNAKNMDLAVNSDELRWSDRFGRDRKSLEGMEREFDADQDFRYNAFESAQTYRESRFNDFIVSSGYQFLGDYGPSIELTEYNQLVRDANGEFWRLSGQVELPYTTTGAGIPEDDALVPAGDAVLRQDLSNPDKGALLVSGAVIYAGSVEEVESKSLPVGITVFLTEEGRAGEFVVKAGSPPNDPLKGIYIPLANGHYAERLVKSPAYVSWFAPDPSDAAPALTAALNSGAGVVFGPVVGETLIVNSQVKIESPVTFMGRGGIIKVHGRDIDGNNSTLFDEFISTFLIQSSNVTFDGIEIDGNSRNNYETLNGFNLHYDEAVYGESGKNLGSAMVAVDCHDLPNSLENINIVRCTLRDSSASTINLVGDFSDLSDDVPKVKDVTVRDCTLIHGQRAVIASSGARRVYYINNRFINPYWNTIQFYLDTQYGTAEGNRVDKDLDEMDLNLASLGAQNSVYGGFSVGHESRAVGSTHHITIHGNTLNLAPKSQVDARGLVCEARIRVSGYTSDVQISDNIIRNASHGLLVRLGASKIIFSGNSIYAPQVHGVLIEGMGTAPEDEVADVTLTDNLIDSAEVRGISASFCRRATISNNTIINPAHPTAYGIDVRDSAHFSVTGNKLFSTGGILAERFNGFNISSNLIERSEQAGRGITCTASTGGYTRISNNSINNSLINVAINQVDNVVISNNILGGAAEIDVNVVGCTDVEVVGNLAKSIGTGSIQVHSSNDVSVSANSLKYRSNVLSGSTSVTFSGNNFNVPSLAHCLTVSSDSVDTRIVGNSFRGFTTSGVLDSSGSAIVEYNIP